MFFGNYRDGRLPVPLIYHDDRFLRDSGPLRVLTTQPSCEDRQVRPRLPFPVPDSIGPA